MGSEDHTDILPPRPDPGVTRATFVLESVRSLTAGIQETAFGTFAILIAVKHFSMSPGAKAALLGSLAIGMLGGLFLLPWIARRNWRVSRAASGVQLLSMFGYLAATFSGSSGWLYLAGMCVGMGILPVAIPLQTHYLHANFPGSRRGRLFSITIVIRSLSAIVFSWSIGWLLDRDFSQFPKVIALFALASGIAAVTQFLIPSRPIGTAVDKPAIGQSLGWLRDDPIFARIILATMAMGIGVLSTNALRVDYLVNPAHPLHLDARTVAVITGVIPSLVRLISTFFWGWLFDRMNFFKLRALVNLVFLLAVPLYFSSGDKLSLIALGAGLFGLARGGGEILWNLWVTKVAAPSHIAGYMSVHTFMTGLRTALAPFLGFYVVKFAGLPTMIALSSFFILLALVILWPLTFPRLAPGKLASR